MHAYLQTVTTKRTTRAHTLLQIIGSGLLQLTKIMLLFIEDPQHSTRNYLHHLALNIHPKHSFYSRYKSEELQINKISTC